MGRYSLQAVGVAAVAAMMQSPADSFVGTGGAHSTRRLTISSSNNNASSLQTSKRKGTRDLCERHRAPWERGLGLRRPAGWQLACGVRGGKGSGGESGGSSSSSSRTGADPGIESTLNNETPSMASTTSPSATVTSTSSSNGSTSTSSMRSGSSSTGSGSSSSSGGSQTSAGQGTREKPPLSDPKDVSGMPQARPSRFPTLPLPPPSSEDRERDAFDNRERAGFSLFHCDAYHCEREMVESGEIYASAPATTQVMMRWNEQPRRALVLLKPDEELLPLAAQTIDYLQRDMGLKVMVEAAAADAVGQALDEFTRGHGDARTELEVFTPPERSREAIMGPKGEAGPVPPPALGDGDSVDFVLTLGGDGLLMYSNTLFRRSVPPHLCFNLGSMGFLTPFEYDFMREEVRRIMNGGMKVSLRMRLSARIMRDDQTSEAFHALNEIVIDRGSSPYLTNLECYCDEQHLTTVQADGLIIATPTGSTAYSMSAGGSMVHPCVPAILFTPICPHSLSFRPIVFPDTVVLRLSMPQDARAEARVSFDGKLSQPLRRGDTLVIKTSNFPVPTICKDDSTADWFSSLDQALGFNTRMRQRAFQPPSMDKVRARNDDRFDE